jgi:hypothetical protein
MIRIADRTVLAGDQAVEPVVEIGELDAVMEWVSATGGHDQSSGTHSADRHEGDAVEPYERRDLNEFVPTDVLSREHRDRMKAIDGMRST